LASYDVAINICQAGTTACIVTKDSIRLIMNHSAPVCGCAFDLFNPDLLAVVRPA